MSLSERELRPQPSLPRPTPPDLPDDPEATWPHLRRVDGPVSLGEYLSRVWRWRTFMVRIPLAERHALNQDQVLGQFWNLLNPLLLIAVYYFVFGVILGIESRRGVDHYLPYLIVSIIAFNYTRASIQVGTKTIIRNQSLMKSINFPRAVTPLSALFGETIGYFYALPLMLLLASLVTGGPRPQVSWFLLVPVIIIQGMFNLGMLMILARVTVHFRDVQQFLPYTLRILTYVSGVLWPLNDDLIPNLTLLAILQANPIYNLMEMTRGAVLHGTMPPRAWLLGTAWAVGTLVIGFTWFRRGEHEYANVH